LVVRFTSAEISFFAGRDFALEALALGAVAAARPDDAGLAAGAALAEAGAALFGAGAAVAGLA
jgi:hypothetical protein